MFITAHSTKTNTTIWLQYSYHSSNNRDGNAVSKLTYQELAFSSCLKLWAEAEDDFRGLTLKNNEKPTSEMPSPR